MYLTFGFFLMSSSVYCVYNGTYILSIFFPLLTSLPGACQSIASDPTHTSLHFLSGIEIAWDAPAVQ